METITYSIKSRLWNDMLSDPNLSTGGYLNKLSRAIETPEQANRVWILFQQKVGGYRVVKWYTC